MHEQKRNKIKSAFWIFFTILFYVIVSGFSPPTGLSVMGWKSIIFLICVIITLTTEWIPIGIASCLFLFIPELLHLERTSNLIKNFAIHPMFFILASGIIAEVFVSIGLGYRISLYVTTIFGTKSIYILLGFMLCTALISSVLADIPTSIIMSSIAKNILDENNMKAGESNSGKGIMLGIPIAACLGGFATPIGSGINILCLDLLKQIGGIQISFFQWTIIGAPMAFIMTVVAWLVIVIIYKPETKIALDMKNVSNERGTLGRLSSKEKLFLTIFSVTLLLWMTQGITGLDLTLIAILCASIFFLPFVNLIDWKRAQEIISWSGILLVGTTNTLVVMLLQGDVTEWINELLGGIVDCSLIQILFFTTIFGLFIHLLTPIGSTVVSLGVPIVYTLAEKAGINPIYLVLIIGYTAKCVFLIPLDPIPLTTIHYGYWKMFDMIKIGFVIAVIWIPIMVLFMVSVIYLGIL